MSVLSNRSLFCSVNIVTGYDPDNQGSIPSKGKSFLFSVAFTLAWGPTGSPIQWVQRVISWGVKLPGHESGHSPPASAEVKNGGVIPPLPHMSSWCSA
jgi:hypothetical protein